MQGQGRNTMTNGGVVITVYVESLKTRSSSREKSSIKETKPYPQFTKGYDRRAHLLAYSRHLRRHDAGYHQLPRYHSRPRSKKKRMWFNHEPVRICSPSTQMAQRSSSSCGHENVALLAVATKESKEVDQSKKRKGSGKNCHPFLRKLKSMLKKLSCKEI